MKVYLYIIFTLFITSSAHADLYTAIELYDNGKDDAAICGFIAVHKKQPHNQFARAYLYKIAQRYPKNKELSSLVKAKDFFNPKLNLSLFILDDFVKASDAFREIVKHPIPKKWNGKVAKKLKNSVNFFKSAYARRSPHACYLIYKYLTIKYDEKSKRNSQFFDFVKELGLDIRPRYLSHLLTGHDSQTYAFNLLRIIYLLQSAFYGDPFALIEYPKQTKLQLQTLLKLNTIYPEKEASKLMSQHKLCLTLSAQLGEDIFTSGKVEHDTMQAMLVANMLQGSEKGKERIEINPDNLKKINNMLLADDDNLINEKNCARIYFAKISAALGHHETFQQLSEMMAFLKNNAARDEYATIGALFDQPYCLFSMGVKNYNQKNYTAATQYYTKVLENDNASTALKHKSFNNLIHTHLNIAMQNDPPSLADINKIHSLLYSDYKLDSNFEENIRIDILKIFYKKIVTYTENSADFCEIIIKMDEQKKYFETSKNILALTIIACSDSWIFAITSAEKDRYIFTESALHLHKQWSSRSHAELLEEDIRNAINILAAFSITSTIYEEEFLPFEVIINYLEEAAEYDNPAANYNLGTLHCYADADRAIKYLEKAQELGHPLAAELLGMLYFSKQKFECTRKYLETDTQSSLISEIVTFEIENRDEKLEKYDGISTDGLSLSNNNSPIETEEELSENESIYLETPDEYIDDNILEKYNNNAAEDYSYAAIKTSYEKPAPTLTLSEEKIRKYVRKILYSGKKVNQRKIFNYLGKIMNLDPDVTGIIPGAGSRSKISLGKGHRRTFHKQHKSKWGNKMEPGRLKDLRRFLEKRYLDEAIES
jgi:TPR repeat protein